MLPAGAVRLAVFGYFTATLATYFMGHDAESEQAEIAGSRQIEALQQEMAALRQEIQGLVRLHTPEKQLENEVVHPNPLAIKNTNIKSDSSCG